MQINSPELPNLNKMLRGRQFRIPQFQRDFTWNISQVRLLIDSLARNYPIGSLLVLPESPDIPLHSRSIDAVINSNFDGYNDEPADARSEVYYVLDGQQRLTSIARVFLNADNKKSYYFDLKKMHTQFEMEGHGWVVARQRGKNDPDRKDKNRLLRADIALDYKKTDLYVSEYFEDSDDFPEFRDSRSEGREAAAKIKGVFETIRNYRVPIVVLDKDSGIESVCRVFETINSTGTRLTTFDLAVARFYPNPDLRELLKETEQRFPILGPEEFGVDGERILQVLHLCKAHKGQSFYEPTRGSLLALDSQFIITHWDAAATGLAEAYSWARDQWGARPDTLPNAGILVSIAAFMVLFPKQFSDPFSSVRSILKRWFFSTMLQQGARVAINYQIGEDFRALVAFAEQGTLMPNPIVQLTADKIVELNGRDNRFRAIQCIMAMSAKHDVISGNSVGANQEDHHIFPRSLTKKGILREKLDSIANMIPVGRETNSKLSDTPPADYFGAIRDDAILKGIAPDVNKRLRDCLIPGDITESGFLDQFQVSNFDRFLLRRATLILEQVRNVVGDSLQVVDNTNEDDDE